MCRIHRIRLQEWLLEKHLKATNELELNLLLLSGTFTPYVLKKIRKVFCFILQDPGGLADYIAAEYIPDFLGGPYEVRRHLFEE